MADPRASRLAEALANYHQAEAELEKIRSDVERQAPVVFQTISQSRSLASAYTKALE